MKRLALLNDLSGVGRCSLTVMLPLLSAMGYQCCPLPTAVLSSHTAYPEYFRRSLSPELPEYFEAWRKNGFFFDALLSGYFPDTAGLEQLRSYLASCPELPFFLDPVMADHGRLYTGMTEQHVSLLRSLMGSAALLCPNLTEACFLADFDYGGLTETLESCGSDSGRLMVLHALVSELRSYTEGSIVITGIEAGTELLNCVAEAGRDIVFVRSRRCGQNRPGTGDIFFSLLSGACLSGEALPLSVQRAADFVGDAICLSEQLALPVREGVPFELLLRSSELLSLPGKED